MSTSRIHQPVPGQQLLIVYTSSIHEGASFAQRSIALIPPALRSDHQLQFPKVIGK